MISLICGLEASKTKQKQIHRYTEQTDGHQMEVGRVVDEIGEGYGEVYNLSVIK